MRSLGAVACALVDWRLALTSREVESRRNRQQVPIGDREEDGDDDSRREEEVCIPRGEVAWKCDRLKLLDVCEQHGDDHPCLGRIGWVRAGIGALPAAHRRGPVAHPFGGKWCEGRWWGEWHAAVSHARWVE